MTGPAVLAALGAAVCFGGSAALMHYEAFTAPAGIDGAYALLNHLARQRLWVLGMLASLGGLALHAVALTLGPLTVVQPLVVTGLVFSFIFRSALERRWPTRGTLAGAAVTTLGLVLFLVAAQVGSPPVATYTDGPGALVMLGLGGAAAAAACLLSRAASAARSAFLLGVSAGIVFGLIAGVLKVTTALAGHGLPALLGSWPLYVLAALGGCGLILNQRAYQGFALTHSLPALNAVNPMVALVFGYAVFGERPAHGLTSLGVEAVGLALVIVGVVAVVRTAPPALAGRDSPVRTAPAPSPALR